MSSKHLLKSTPHLEWHSALTAIFKADASPHCQNLLHQCLPRSAAHSKSEKALGNIIPAYLTLEAAIVQFDASKIEESAPAICLAFDHYMSVLRLPENDLFSSVSDLKTSAVPEFFLKLFAQVIQHHSADPLEVSGQRDIPVELSFDIRTEHLVIARTQRVDAAIIAKAPLKVAERELRGFCVPVFAAEVKTYFDKNMLAGVDQSAAGMKSTFPHCLYFGICEFADFELSAHSYAGGAIDEIYILRHQKRSEFRQTGVSNPIDHELVCEIVKRVELAVCSHASRRSDLGARIKTGKLIG